MRKTTVAAAIAAAAVFAGTPTAHAGACPDASLVQASAKVDGDHTKNIGVTDTTLAVNELGTLYPELASRNQRLRVLTVEPGGEVALHSHADRPALIYIVTGEIVEHRSSCAVPIVHRAGEVAQEFGNLEHWWKNETDQQVTMISADLPRAD